jgi:hypothetical protein
VPEEFFRHAGDNIALQDKKTRRVCRSQAAKNSNHFSPRHARGEKYLSGCQCGIFAHGAKIMRAADCNPILGKTFGFSRADIWGRTGFDGGVEAG